MFNIAGVISLCHKYMIDLIFGPKVNISPHSSLNNSKIFGSDIIHVRRPFAVIKYCPILFLRLKLPTWPNTKGFLLCLLIQSVFSLKEMYTLLT